jgi:uncharacterized protein
MRPGSAVPTETRNTEVTQMTQMIAEGLFRLDDDKAVLIGSRRTAGGAVRFPAEPDVLFEDDDAPELIELSTEGTLYTFTTQQFPPPLPYKGNRDPDGFMPYVVGYVELGEGLLVESLIVGANTEELRIGQAMTTTTTTLETGDGQTLLTYAFTPVASAD